MLVLVWVSSCLEQGELGETRDGSGDRAEPPWGQLTSGELIGRDTGAGC